jgi:hypothetical protein
MPTISHPVEPIKTTVLETTLLNRPKIKQEIQKEETQKQPIGQKQRILRKITTRLTKGINPEEWNYYCRIPQSLNKALSKECRAIRFNGRNLTAITQPTGIHAVLNPFATVSGGIYFRQTSYCPAQTLGVGEYLSWDGKCFTVMDDEQFHSIYKHG